MNKKLILFLLGASVVAACSSGDQNTESVSGEPIGINVAYMDTTVSPGEDFFRYVNGKWLDQTEIPADRERWGSFDELRKKTTAQTLSVLEKAAASGKYPATSDQGKAATFFAVAMDTNGLDKLGIAPLTPWLRSLENIRSYRDVIYYEKELAPYGGDALFGFGIGSDPKNSNDKVIYVGGGALGLPDRDYYLDDDSISVDRRKKYEKHVARMLEFTGLSPADAATAATNVLQFETEIAATKLDKVARRNPYNRYNPHTIAELDAITPGINWATYLNSVGLGNYDTVILSEVKYMEHLGEVLAKADLQTIKDYLRWQLIDQSAPYLTTEIDRANWEFYAQELRGAKQQRKRNERALATVNRTLGEAVGQLYVDEYFPPEAKAVAVEMVNNLRRAYEQRIMDLEWMSPETKQKAIGKLETFNVKIGYPDEWKDYSELKVGTIEAGRSYLGNIMAARKFNFDEEIRKAGEPVDKSEWFMSPQTVNAYYNPPYNEIVFPAAILQPPFYDYRADAAVNYGGIGAVIGHEISHGFDDQGAKYDKDGNLNSWWTPADSAAFADRNAKLIEQFDAYEPLPGVNVNGKFTLGENIGDLGGINAAYDALQLHLAEHGNPGEIDGFTQAQRFFISWGTIWRTKYRDKALENQIDTDPHSPGMYRAAGPVVNVQAFYDAFGITPESKEYVAAEDRVVIW